MRLGEFFVRALRAVRRQRRDCNFTEALVLVLLADGEWHNTTEVARRAGERVRDVFFVMRKMRRRGLVESYVVTKIEGNWWRMTGRGEEVLRAIFRRMKEE